MFYQLKANHREILVYASASTDLGDIWADLAFVKRAITLDDGKQYILFPGDDTWHEVGGNGTVTAADIPDPVEPVNPFPPKPSGAAVVGSAKVGEAKVG